MIILTESDEKQWLSYLLAKASADRMPELSMQEREKMIRNSIRANLRGGYDRYPMTLYVKLKRQQQPDESRYSPEVKATLAKMREDTITRKRECEAIPYEI